MRYDAFLSYSHEDIAFAEGLQRSLERFASPFSLKRSMRVFRDETGMDASPDLSKKIEQALDQSPHLILLASPASASSRWVHREIRHFLSRHNADALLVVVVRGRVPSLDQGTTPYTVGCSVSEEVHGLLQREFEEPYLHDLRRYRTESGRLDRKADGVETKIASLSAAILGRSKEDLIGQHRGRRRRFWSATFAVALLFCLVVVFGVNSESNRRRASRLEGSRNELKVVCGRLQEALNNLQRNSWQLVGGVRASAEVAILSAPPNAEIRRLANTLRGLLKTFESDFPEDELLLAETLDIRLGHAVLANAEQRYHRTLQIITDGDAQAQQERTEAQIEQEVRIHRVLGYAKFRLRQWRLALIHYQRILVLRPNRLGPKSSVAVCLWRIGELDEAERLCDEVVDRLTYLVEEGSSDLRKELAIRLDNRGLVLRDLGKLDRSLADYDRAIEIHSRLAEQRDQSGADPDLARSYAHRGLVLRDLGRLDRALEDYNRAVEIYVRLVQREEPSEFEHCLAMWLNNRGIVLCDMGKFEQSLEDYDRAIETYHDLVQNEKRHDLKYFLAACHHHRGVCRKAFGKFDEAVQDYNKAIEIRTQLMKELGPENVGFDLASSYKNRGNVRNDQGNLVKAIEDFDKTIEIVTQLVEQEGRKDLTGKLISLLNDTAWLYATHPDDNLRNGELAVQRANRACTLTNWQHSACLDTLAAACAEVDDFDAAMKWQTQAVEIASESNKDDLRIRLREYEAGRPYRDNTLLHTGAHPT